jgi:hypothetical protein
VKLREHYISIGRSPSARITFIHQFLLVNRDGFNLTNTMPTKRPISVNIIAILYLAVGTIGFVYHGYESLRQTAFPSDAYGIEITEFLAIIAGVFMLRGQNWARWLAVAWMAFHVVVSAFHNFREFAIHTLLLALIAWILFRPKAAQYFNRSGTQPA